MQGLTIYLGEPTKEELALYPEDVHLIVKDEINLFDKAKEYSLQISKRIQLYNCHSFKNLDVQQKAILEVKKLKEFADSNIYCIQKDEKTYLKHIFENVRNSYKSIHHLFGKFKDIPCIIVSAGPSLDKNIQFLKQNKAIIIAVAPILEKLNKAGIEVDFVVSIDPFEFNIQHFENITKFPPLVFNYTLNSEIAKFYKGDKYMSWNDNPVLDGICAENEQIHTGMSVAHYAFNLATKLGCSPIIFTGQDLALEDGRSHASGTAQYDESTQIGTIKVAGYYGDKVNTNSNMKSYLYLFQELFQLSDRKIYNCTEGGAFIKGSEHKPLKEVLEILEELNKDFMIEYLDNIPKNEKKDKINTFLHEKLLSLEEFTQDLRLYIKALKKVILLFQKSRFAKGFSELDKMRTINVALDKNADMLKRLRHLVIDIHANNKVDETQILKAIQKEDYKTFIKYLELEKEKFDHILDNVKYLNGKYKELL